MIRASWVNREFSRTSQLFIGCLNYPAVLHYIAAISFYGLADSGSARRLGVPETAAAADGIVPPGTDPAHVAGARLHHREKTGRGRMDSHFPDSADDAATLVNDEILRGRRHRPEPGDFMGRVRERQYGVPA